MYALCKSGNGIPRFTTQSLFRCSHDEAEFFHLAFVFRAAFHDINPCGVNAGVTEEVSQFCYILLRPVEGHGEQMAEIMREHLPGVHASRRAQSLKLFPDVGAVQGLSVSRHEQQART